MALGVHPFEIVSGGFGSSGSGRGEALVGMQHVTLFAQGSPAV